MFPAMLVCAVLSGLAAISAMLEHRMLAGNWAISGFG
jgi:hypothetical protein